jgi:cytochrome b561
MATVPEVREQQPLRRYSNVAVALHWIVAAFVLFQIWLGLSFADMAQGSQRTDLFTWHKTIGATIFLLALARLTYRLMNPPPPFPPELPRWERLSAVWNHRLLYLLLVGLPIGGFIAVSSHSKDGTTTLLGGVRIPVIPGVSKQLGETAGNIHSALAWVLIGLLVLHVAAALKQQFFDRPGRMAGRMPPFQPRTHEPVVSDARAKG